MPEFPLEKILTISARDWAETAGKQLSDYHAVGVHRRDPYPHDPFYHHDPRCFEHKLPQDTEVVVGYIFSFKSYRPDDAAIMYESGTALIPKKT